MSVNQIFLRNEAATLKFGSELARATFRDPEFDEADILDGIGVPSIGGTVYLHGDLGAGKTTLSRGLMRGYGYKGAVKSPTYTLVEPYEFEQCRLYHFDLYRLADPGEVEYLGVETYFSDTNLCIIEWAEKGFGTIPAADLKIDIEVEGTGRLLVCQSLSEKGATIVKRLWPTGRNL